MLKGESAAFLPCMLLRTEKHACMQIGVAELEAGQASLAQSLDAKQARDAAAVQQAASAVVQDARLVHGALLLHLLKIPGVCKCQDGTPAGSLAPSLVPVVLQHCLPLQEQQ